jgi:uncharacterized protein (DUF4213/DUF364 family)
VAILDELISNLGGDAAVREVHACVFWTAVVSRNCGLASTFAEGHPYHRAVRGVGGLIRKSALELAQYAKSENLLEASIGMAAINSLIDIDESKTADGNAFDILAQKGRDKNIAVVGHFPWVRSLKAVAGKLWVIEQRPQQGDLPAEAVQEILPRADVVGITGTSLINHTLEELLGLSKKSYVVVIGPTTPLSPVLFDWGVDVVAGVKVTEIEKTVRCISEGAIFSQVEGIRLVTMARDTYERGENL